MKGTAVFLVEALRTPFGRYGGALALVRPDDLLAGVFLSTGREYLKTS
jgi:acetyl-CoA acetyltransferase